MFIVVDKDNKQEYEHKESSSARERLVGLCSAGISAYMYKEREYIIINQDGLLVTSLT